MSIVCICEFGCKTPKKNDPRGFQTYENREQHYLKSHKKELLQKQKNVASSNVIEPVIKSEISHNLPPPVAKPFKIQRENDRDREAINALLKAFGDFNLHSVHEISDIISSINANGEQYQIEYKVKKVDFGFTSKVDNDLLDMTNDEDDA
uniref:Uncharacterized protein n=1 Tax=Chromulina nebulosa TaxID=96789 RepID=A0A7S0SW68_9STRA|mmetsp:Transcript_3178/g.2828  ORF Transcript_3178/g.2828 Transcript_3178/m.2828 type:complete len:150 (+) Transcript_3178:38-487(+)